MPSYILQVGAGLLHKLAFQKTEEDSACLSEIIALFSENVNAQFDLQNRRV